jgi:signal transduction protein with GAF and PtsI domain
MKVEKEHLKKTLMKWNKERLVDYIMCLEHNNNALAERFEIQYQNCMRLLDDVKAVQQGYRDAKALRCCVIRSDADE